MEEMTVLEMQRFLNQQYAEGKTELEALRNLMAILGLKYIKRADLLPLSLFYTIPIAITRLQ